MQWRILKRFNNTKKNFYIAPQDFDDFDEIFAGNFEQEIEEIVTQSIGSILMAVGDAMTSEEQNNSEQRVNTFDERISTLGEELELEVGSKVNNIESKAEEFCRQLKRLDKLESKLNSSIKELNDFDLIQAY